MSAYAAASGLTVDPQGTNFNGYFDRLATQVAGGNAPDVFQVYLATMAEYAARGTIEPLDKYLGSVIDTTDWAEAALGSTDLDGTKYYVPLGLANQPAIIYDVTLLESIGIGELKPDWTLAEFKDTCLEIAKALTAKNGSTSYGSDDLGGSIPVFESLHPFQGGKNVFSAEGGLSITKGRPRRVVRSGRSARQRHCRAARSASRGGFEPADHPRHRAHRRGRVDR